MGVNGIFTTTYERDNLCSRGEDICTHLAKAFIKKS